ncbi:hypothetical protein [Roseovarius sp. TE539]|uniref:hypothetical protein n=1 Tax=Roseovarius sp. TE539 TaxID=2249812 RepID=UPI00215C1A0A|nr:hypothetical protein [Roseovarius sp. TE539]
MKQVRMLEQEEAVHLDSARLRLLYDRLGKAGAENVVCRALEELALRLTHAESCHRRDKRDDMRRSAHSLIAISEQIGLHLLARVAADVTACIDLEDRTALAATLARLLRVGERSLCEAWELQDLSI